MSSPRYTLEINTVSQDYISLKVMWFNDRTKPHEWSAKLASHGAIVNKQNTVNIKRDNISIFQGILETKIPLVKKATGMDVSGRHASVRLWRKQNERYADMGGFWTNYYPNKIVEFLLHPSRSDRPDIDNMYRRVGWGIDPSDWMMDASNREDASHEEENVGDRLNTIGWQLGINQVNAEYIEVDLGAQTSVCGIRIENRTSSPEEFVRNYKIETSTTGAWGGEEIEVATKTNNRAINIVESWTAATTRYIRIICTAAFADDWRISEIFIYESSGEISGISVGTLDEHLPLNCSLMSANANVGQPDVVVKEGWRFQPGDDVIIGDDNAEEINSIDSISDNTLTMDVNLANNYTTANNGFVTNLQRFTEVNLEYGRRIDSINRIVKLCTTDDVEWEWECTDAGVVNMGARVGTNRSGTHPFIADNMGQRSNKTDDKTRIDEILVLGKGKGQKQDLVSSGWQGSGEYESILVDTKLETTEACLLKAKAILEKYSSGVPQPSVIIEDDPYQSGTWGIDDDITLTDSITGFAGSYRVKQVTRFYSAAGEKVTVQCEHAKDKTADVISRLQKLLTDTRQEGEYPKEIFDEVTGENPFILFYETEELTLDPDATVESDTTSSNDRHVKMVQAEAGIIWWGPGASLKAGKYQAIFYCKVTDHSDGNPLVTIDAYSQAYGGVFESITLNASVFGAANTWEAISFLFELDAEYTDVEFRANAFQTGITDFYCDWVGIAAAPVLKTTGRFEGAAGVEIDDSGIRGYSDATTKTFELVSASGYIIVYGDGLFQIKKADGTLLGYLDGTTYDIALGTGVQDAIRLRSGSGKLLVFEVDGDIFAFDPTTNTILVDDDWVSIRPQTDGGVDLGTQAVQFGDVWGTVHYS